MEQLPHPSEFPYDLWEYLSHTDKPIVLYGMGNGADKILTVTKQLNIPVADFFASDGFVRGQVFHGKIVRSFEQIRQTYKNFIILLSFGTSRPEVLAPIYSLSKHFELYAPDVPVFGNTLFTRSFYKANHEKFKQVFKLLADMQSKEIFCNVIRYKITGDIRFLRKAISPPDFEKKLLPYKSYHTFIDAGAYNGDTSRAFIDNCSEAKRIYAIEPDPKNFKKLLAYAETETRAKVFPFEFGAWQEESKAEFSVCGNRNSNCAAQTSNKTKTVLLRTIDSLGIQDADYVKFDVEGAEKQAFLGALKTISAGADVLLSLYHRSEDLFELPLLMHRHFPNYRLFLRRRESLPAWDLNLYALKGERYDHDLQTVY